MDFAIATSGGDGDMTFNPATDIYNNIFLSLVTRQGSFFHRPALGSRLYLLERAKNTAKSAALAREYCREALQWLLDTGRATSIEVFTEVDRRDDLNRLKILVEATQADGRKVTFETFMEVV